MKRYQLGYSVFVLFTMILLYFTGSGFLLGLVTLQIIFPIILSAMLRSEARALNVTWDLPHSGMAGQDFGLKLTVGTTKENTPRGFKNRMLRGIAAASVLIDFTIENRLLGETRREEIVLPLRGRKEVFTEALAMDKCGNHILHCQKVQVQDVFGLFRRSLTLLPERSVMVYPEKAGVELLHRQDMAPQQVDGRTAQNRKGNDRTEIYDLREYAAGDDIRSIHWKLSSKLGKRIIREAGSSSQLRTLILVDEGRFQNEENTSAYTERTQDSKNNIKSDTRQRTESVPCESEALCAGISVAASLSEALIHQGYAHAVGLRIGDELQLMQVLERESYVRSLESGLAAHLPEKCGLGLLVLLSQKSDYEFTRLFYVTTATALPIQALRGMDDAEVTVIQVEDREGEVLYFTQDSVDVISVPARTELKNGIKLMI